MNEQDEYAMMLARMKALEAIALECFEELRSPLPPDICKYRLEAAIAQFALGCSNPHKATS